MQVHQDLIFDLGVNQGEDSAFYLAKGFRVVGVEANLALARAVAATFRDEIAAGRYTLLAAGLWSAPGSLPFYVNLDNHHWSSFDRAYGCREGTRFEVVPVQCLTIADVIAAHGMPRYMKVDVEGADRIVLKGLEAFSPRPPFVSVEEYGVAAVDDLAALGYSRFAFVPQHAKRLHRPPKPAREGRYAERAFTMLDTGLFGRELPEPWMDYGQAREAFVATVRREDGTWTGPEGEWFDVHAALPGALPDAAGGTPP
ncbi:MAG TPA: FkbM family methyltransferase [Beijerinckiaceae bacterium]|jgi:FkbM family methyltransferase